MGISTEEYNKRKIIEQALEKGARIKDSINARYANEVATITKDALSYARKKSKPLKAVEEVIKYYKPKW